ncbi:DUF3944 domain-containing protein [Alloalcanivorax xenomutans]|uniref:DUF3944 domain-containing protein n=1 Tax=Alloalcanivorax xenomutans TaxID=1094342 RepID=UPI00047D5D4B
MGISFREDDKDLAFLQYCGEEDLQQLANILIYDVSGDGQERITSELAQEERFKKLEGRADRYRKCWDLIAGELQHYGGDTIVNLFRRGGVAYKELLGDACEKLKVKFDKKKSAYEIEDCLLAEVVNRSWKDMDDEQKRQILDGVGLDETIDSAKIDEKLRNAVFSSASASMFLASTTAGMVAKAVALNVGMGGVRYVVARVPVVGLGGPILWTVLGLSAIPSISGTAYRVTIPASIQVAYMRRKIEFNDHFGC